MTGSPPALIVFSGLPGTGKTTVSRILARGLGAVYLRMDSIEQAMRSAGAKCIGPAGYAVANALAESNLRLGLSVVADCVNPLLESRVAWADVAVRASATPLRIHVECSDAAEHRRRWLERGTDIPDLVLPTWEEVVQRGLSRSKTPACGWIPPSCRSRRRWPDAALTWPRGSESYRRLPRGKWLERKRASVAVGWPPPCSGTSC